MNQRLKRRRQLSACLGAALALFAFACAGSRPPDATGPRTNNSPYPVLLNSAPDRQTAALAAWTSLTSEQGIQNAPAPELQSVTATIQSLPALNPPLYLPKVGAEATMSEEETRESLRRFIVAQSTLLGAQPPQLSLVERTDKADGTKQARYEQRPFRYPLRNGYGVIEIGFAPDRRILGLSSTAIPEVEFLQRAGTGFRPHYTAEAVAARLVGRTFAYAGAAGAQQTYTVAAGEEILVRGLVVYPIQRQRAEPPALEFHLAWEIAFGPQQARTLYVDAITDEIIAATQTSQS